MFVEPNNTKTQPIIASLFIFIGGMEKKYF